MKKDLLKFVLSLTSWLGIFAMIYSAWATIDIIEFGRQQPSVSDTLFGIILAFQLHDRLITRLNKEVKTDGR